MVKIDYFCPICKKNKKTGKFSKHAVKTSDGAMICWPCIIEYVDEVFPINVGSAIDMDNETNYTFKTNFSLTDIQEIIREPEKANEIIERIIQKYSDGQLSKAYTKYTNDYIVLGNNQYCRVYYDKQIIEVMLKERFLSSDIWKKYRFDELWSYEYFENSETIATGGTGIGRAIVGGAMFGGVGAIVGAATKRRNENNIIKEMKIMLTFKDSEHNLFITIPISIDNDGWFELKKGSKGYSACYARALSIMAALDDIYITGHPNDIQQNNISDLSNELLELKKLLDSGIITDEEFAQKKKQILNL